MKRGWGSSKLIDITDLITCGVAKRPEYVDEGVPFLSAKNVKKGEIVWSDYKFVSQETHSELTKNNKPRKGDILYTRVGSFGEAAIVDRDEEFSIFVSLTLIKPKREILSSFLKYYLNSNYVKQLAKNSISGIGVGNLNVGSVRKFPVPVPPLDKQKRIVAILDEAFAGIDAAIANTEKNLANVRELFESYLNLVFTQQDEGWKEKTLKDVCIDFGRGKSKHRPRNDPKLYGGSYPFIQTGDVRNCEHLIKESTKTYNDIGLSQSKLWPKGTICITIAANIAETGILDFEACFPDSIIGMVVDHEQATNAFVEYLLQSVKARIKAKGKGSAQANINLATFENEFFYFPSLETQADIVSKLHDLVASIQRLESTYLQKLNALNELKQSLLQKAFSGELTSDNKVVAFPNSKAAKDADPFSSEFSAKILAFAYHRHAAKKRHKTFGRVKAQKTLHLVESIAGIDLDRHPIKDAAGPNDFQHMLRAEEWAKANQFFEFVSRGEGKGYDFKKLVRYDELIAGIFATLKPYQQRLEQVIDLIIPKKSRETELIVTVHAAWNNLILDGCKITDEAILRAARENWHPDKMKIPLAEFQQAIRFIRDKGIIPDGKAKRVTGQESLF